MAPGSQEKYSNLLKETSSVKLSELIQKRNAGLKRPWTHRSDGLHGPTANKSEPLSLNARPPSAIDGRVKHRTNCGGKTSQSSGPSQTGRRRTQLCSHNPWKTRHLPLAPSLGTRPQICDSRMGKDHRTFTPRKIRATRGRIKAQRGPLFPIENTNTRRLKKAARRINWS
ncbi:hypothetical protein K0M31_012823 [Melipona bicolor]|uniref:Uncharacterized protein n=1 Tax=Melipona bicolor TaxID=60889 RepID=A0AA40FJG4_9HYME|nr:hypothetical protein K0M31_012823 [Melipona bicolor]